MNTVIINCFDTYEHRVELLRRCLTQQGHQVRVITSSWRHFKKSVRTEAPQGYELIKARPYYKNLSADRLISHHYFAKDALARAEQYAPDLLWVLAPPNSLVKQAAGYKKRHPGVKLVLDFIDMWPETMPISRFKNLPPFSNWRLLRDNYAAEADAVVTECNLYWQLLEKCCPKQKLHTLYLARPIQPSDSAPDPAQDGISLCYLGSINNIIDIPCIAGIIRAIDAPVRLHVIGDGEKREELLQQARDAGAEVIFHGKVYDHAEKQRIMDQCHFGLNIMKPSVFVGLTMKSMDYWECGLPILNNIRGDTWSFVENEGIGLNIDQTSQLPLEKLHKVQEGRSGIRPFFEEHFSEEIFRDKVTAILSGL